MNITIITPTYNRSEYLDRLYQSLINQTEKNFEWLIIDDGSTDNTKKIIDTFIQQDKILIRYFYKENGGKHRALNYGIERINNELTFIVDSDDYLKSDAIELINYYYKKYNDKDSICGYSFLRGYSNNKINGPKYPKDEFISDYITCRLNNNIYGDKAEVYYTKKLKEVPFIEIEGEKFLVESYVWGQLALKYNMVYINKIIYLGEYLNGGLTDNRKLVKINSPKGTVETAKVLCNSKANIKVKCKALIFYIAYGKYAKMKFFHLYKKINYKFLFLMMYPFGLLYKKILDFKFVKEGKSNDYE